MSAGGAQRGGDAATSVDPLDLLVAIGRRKRWLVTWPLAAALFAAAVSLVLPKSYTAVTRLMPPQQAQSAAASMLSQLGGLAGAAGGALGLKNPSDLYVGILGSRTVADALIERFKLQEHYGQEFLVDTRKALAGDTRVKAEKNGIIVVEVDARTPTLAADLANAYVSELNRLTGSLAVTEAAQRRAFFERHLQQTKDRLAEAEASVRQAIDSGGLVSVDAQSRAAVETVARLRAEISTREIQLRAMRAYATEDHPELRRAERELASMRQALARLESGPGVDGEAPAGAGGKTAGGLDTIKLVREVKYHEVMMELLARQYELARVDESREAPLIQVLDPAQPPEKRSWPRRTMLVLATGAAALVAALLAAAVEGGARRLASDPARQVKLEALRAAWRRRVP